jgi:hypothetical protein
MFKKPCPLDRVAHKSLTLDRKAGFGFARDQIAVPATLGEFAAAARDYPIVFAGDSPQPFLLLGLREGKNLMVDDSGKWRKGRYVPAHLRRYPFAFMETPDKKFVVCIDEAAEHFTAEQKVDAQPLFVDGSPAPMVGDAMKFLAAFQNEFLATQEFGAALVEEGLLIERRAMVEPAGGGSPFSLMGFRIIDEQKLAAVKDETFLSWRKRGWVAPIYFHLQSLNNFALLTDWDGEYHA